MGVLNITLKQAACISSGLPKNSLPWKGACYEVYGIPYIPGSLIKDSLEEVARRLIININLSKCSVTLSNARPKGYQGIIQELDKINVNELRYPQFVLSYFTDIRPSKDGNPEHYIRTLKDGQVYQAEINAPEEFRPVLTELIRGWTYIGTPPDVGEIEADVDWDATLISASPGWHYPMEGGKEYSVLHYTIQTCSQVGFYSSYDTKGRTKHYISGANILKYIHDNCDDFKRLERLGPLKCANAYLELANVRSMPIPLSFSRKKLFENVLCDWIADGKRPDDNDQLIGIREAYISPAEITDGSVLIAKTQIHTAYFPTEKTVTGIQEMETLSPRQCFKGYIKGTPEQIRIVYDILAKSAVIRIGNYNSVEYGECLLRIDSLEEVKPREPRMLNNFYLNLIAPVILYNEFGMYSCSEDDLLKAVEDALGTPGRLEIWRTFHQIRTTECAPVGWNGRYLQKMCLDKGSVFRFRTKDGEPVDVSPLEDVWIGEWNQEGFGEVSVGDPDDIYYREYSKFDGMQNFIYPPLSVEERDIGSTMVRELSEFLLKYAMDVIARLNASKNGTAESTEETVSKELLASLRKIYSEDLSEEALYTLYVNNLYNELRQCTTAVRGDE